MAALYFGKMNSPEGVNNKEFLTSELGHLGSIQVGDYAFIKLEKEFSPASIKRLWQLKEIQEISGDYKYKACFEEILQFDPIPLLVFEALDLFVLDVNLLNKCNKQTKGLSFYNISLVDESAFVRLVNNPDSFKDYLKNTDHYRKIVKLDGKNLVDPKSINVQLYEEGGTWLFADADFIGNDLKDHFDSNQFDLYDKYGKKGTNTAKDKMYSFLSGNDIDVPMVGLWDLFCGTVNENVAPPKKRTSNKREGFIEYCKENGVGRAADVYESGIRSIESELNKDVDAEYDKDKCKDLLRVIDECVKGLDEDQIGNRRNWSSYVKKYVSYRKSITPSVASTQNDPIVKSYEYSDAKHSGDNLIVYGTPGCGKSYYVENVLLAKEGIDNNSVFRTTFYQDYTNTDFVGQVMPKIENDGSVTYDFIPGPFTKALKCAIDDPSEKVALVIEELNRGNAPSIFGDIFQLLDRKDGESIYPIINVNIQRYLKRESLYDLDYIKIPSNLYIYATMNTSDQNVFTLDTAFKRRWKSDYIYNDFTTEDEIGGKYVPGLNGVTWQSFVKTINDFIINHATSLSAEDKQLGKYFVDDDLLIDDPDEFPKDKLKYFAHKVLGYLWNDVAKFNRADWFNDDVKSLQALFYKYEHNEIFFAPELAAKLPIYTPAEEE